MEERVVSRPAYDMNPGLSRGMYEGPKDNLSSRLYDGPHDKSHITEEPDEAKVSRPGVCPAKAGVFSRRQTYQGKSQSPVARSAGGRETNLLKPLDSLICGMGASRQAVAQSNA